MRDYHVEIVTRQRDALQERVSVLEAAVDQIREGNDIHEKRLIDRIDQLASRLEWCGRCGIVRCHHDQISDQPEGVTSCAVFVPSTRVLGDA